MKRMVNLYKVFRLYYRFNPAPLAFKRAWRIAINGSPF